ncbi:lantibiotic immunity ABC transporter MutG family permease subunit [Paenibacillus sp. GCM10012306]|uniref:lantibiotic immunity ABC transporter MutG family permease subunit n=1 Tax=Paenibacillus sp. GCM10012306 TaxID=3317342 RepID=UPI003612191C
MMRFDRILLADLLKIRRTPLLWIHLFLPLLAAGGLVGYAAISSLDTLSITVAFMELLGVALPLVIGVLTAMLAEQEATAGGFQNLLTTSTPKLLAFLSKLCLLLLMGFVSIMLAVGGFGTGLKVLLHREGPTWDFYVISACVLAGSCIILYIVHLMISLCFGQGASIGLGITGSLLTALLLTGLGDGIWPLMPHSWPIRLPIIWVLYSGNQPMSDFLFTQLRSVIWIGTVATAGLLLLSCVWFTRWEGRKSEA